MEKDNNGLFALFPRKEDADFELGHAASQSDRTEHTQGLPESLTSHQTNLNQTGVLEQHPESPYETSSNVESSYPLIQAQSGANNQVQQDTLTKIKELELPSKVSLRALDPSQIPASEVTFEMQVLSDRLDRLERATAQAQTVAAGDVDGVRRTIALLTAEVVALKTSVREQLRSARPLDLLVAKLEERVTAILEGVRQQRASEQARHDMQEAQLESELKAVARQAADAERAAEEIRSWVRAELDSSSQLTNTIVKDEKKFRDIIIDDLSGSLVARIQQLELGVHHSLGSLNQRVAEISGLERELQTVAQKLTQVDSKHEVLETLTTAWAHTADQIRTLEENLAAQTSDIEGLQRVLEERLCRQSADLTHVKDEVEHFSECMSRLASLLQRNEEIEYRLQAEIAAFKAQLEERQSQLEAKCADNDRFEANLDINLRDLELRVENKFGHYDSARQEVTELKFAIEEFASRLGRVESASEHANALCAQIAALETESTEKQRVIWLQHSEIENLKENVTRGFCAIEDAKTELSGFASRISQMETVATAIDEKITALEAQILKQLNARQQFDNSESKLGSEIGALKSRLLQLELAAREAATFTPHDGGDLRRTVTDVYGQTIDVRNDLTTLQNRLEPTKSLKELEENFARRIGEVEYRVTEQDQTLLGRSVQSEEILRAEISAFKTEVSERQRSLEAQQVAVEKIERALTAKLQDIEQRVDQNLSLARRRDAELKHLKHEMDALSGQVAHFGSSAGKPQPDHVSRIRFTGIPALSEDLEPAAAEEDSAVSMAEPETQVNAKEGMFPNSVAHRDAELEAEKEQLRKLQVRMSAEIEQVRAQLKERNGRWKVRKETTST